MDAFEEVRDSFVGVELKSEKDDRDERDDSDSESSEEEAWRWMLDGQAPRCSNSECNDEFWLIRRRHHCRPCGKIFCRDCCPKDVNGIRQCSNCKLSTNPMLSTFIPAETRNINIRLNHMPRLRERLLKDYNSIDDIPLIKLVSAGPPKKIFKINRELAGGSFGHVFEARDDRVGDRIAIKIISKDPKNSSEQERSIVREVLLHQKVVDHHAEKSHDRLPFPRIHNLFYQKPGLLAPAQTWVTMELIEGDTLADYLRTEYPVHTDLFSDQALKAMNETKIGPLDRMRSLTEAKRRQRSIQTLDLTELDQPALDKNAPGRRSRGISDERVISEFARQILDAVRWVHDSNIVFRDLKADNVMVENDPFTDKKVVRLVDFGSAMELPANTPSIKGKHLVGSYAYMAPETWQLMYSQKSDVWGVGCLVHEIAVGSSPFFWVESKLAELVAEVKAGKQEKERKRRTHEGVSLNADDDEDEPEVVVSVSEVRQRMYNMHVSCEVRMEKKGQDGDEDILRWSSELVDFIRKCLNPDPDLRPTCKELQSHPFIRRYAEAGYGEHIGVEEHYARVHGGYSSPYGDANKLMMIKG